MRPAASTYDGKAIDASPENAAIYQSLMKTGTIPGLPVDEADDTSRPPGQDRTRRRTSNSQFDAWELAAMNIGAAASKSAPLTLDAVEYYNRIIGFPPAASTPPRHPQWSTCPPGAWTSCNRLTPIPLTPWRPPPSSSSTTAGFKYNRSQTFKGSVTWLDVPTLKWKVSKITDVVPFTNLSSYDKIGTRR